MIDPFDAVVWFLVFIISVTVHEGAHALTAYLGGDPTAYHAGQVSLNPVPHMKQEPFGMVILPLIGVFSVGWPIGFASTPYDPAWEQRYPRRAAWMAAAGPGANLALAIAAVAFLRMGVGLELFGAPDSVSFPELVYGHTQFADNLGRFLSMLAFLNAFLCLFNLIPFPPLDGAAMIPLVLDVDTALRLRALLSGPTALIGLLVAWYVVAQLGGPLWQGLLSVVHPEVSYGF